MIRSLGILVTLYLLLLSTALNASAGSVTFKSMVEHYGSPKVSLDLNRELILMTALLSGNTDPELQAVLRKLDLVKVRVYNTLGKSQKAMESIESQTTALSEASWFRVIDREEAGEVTRIFTRSKDQLIEGVVVIKLEPESGELAFVNIVGEIDPSEIKHVASSLNFSFGL